MSRGYFITFEGGEGAGKSTQIERVAETLRRAGHKIVVTREPGGSTGAEAVRHVLLSGAAEALGPAMEAVLFAAARADHVDRVIRPAVERGDIVLCDRFMDSSRVYQGVTGALDKTFMTALERVTVDGMVPDLTLVLDLPVEAGMERAAARRGGETADRFEKEDMDIQQRRRAAYLEIAEAEPERCVVIDASASPDAVAHAIAKAVRALIRSKPAQPEKQLEKAGD